MAKQQSILPEKIAKQKKCPLCECFFVPDKAERFRCEGCEPVLGESLNPAVRELAERLEQEDKAEAVVEKDMPTRDEVEMMIRVIVKEELAAMKKAENILSEVANKKTANSGRTIVWKTKNCIECGNSFVPYIGFQKICTNCRPRRQK